VSDAFEILYAAHTASCTFLLDSEGICRRIQLTKSGKSGKSRDSSRAAARCVGAQYVASLDPTVSGMLAEMPRVGAAMLFARVDERGRVSLVRTGVVTRFEGHQENPFAGGKPKKNAQMTAAPSESVETSAPILPPKPAPPRRREPATVPGKRSLSTDSIQTVRAEDLPRLAPSTVPRTRPMANDFDMTTPYEQKPAAAHLRDARRTTWPSAGASLRPPEPTTLRQPTVLDVTDDADVALLDDEAFSSSPPPPPPRRSEPFMTRLRTERMPARPDAARPPSYPALDQVAPRRRGER
jgi:hypothetical protein